MIRENIRERIEIEKEVRESMYQQQPQISMQHQPYQHQPSYPFRGTQGSANNTASNENSINSGDTATGALSSQSDPSNQSNKNVPRSTFRLHLTGEDNIERLSNLGRPSFSATDGAPVLSSSVPSREIFFRPSNTAIAGAPALSSSLPTSSGIVNNPMITAVQQPDVKDNDISEKK
jgi:hypothetical protein